MEEIIDSDQCEYKIWTGGKVFCEHPDSLIRYCKWSSEFPIGCPLKADCDVNKQVGLKINPKTKRLQET